MNRINSHYLRKLHLEISIMKEIDHPNIIKLREVFYGSRTVYLVMELCHGGELFDEITHNAQRGLTEPHAAKLMW
jgi:calcium-dependent protein kinase